jgi:hypothetical protein
MTWADISPCPLGGEIFRHIYTAVSHCIKKCTESSVPDSKKLKFFMDPILESISLLYDFEFGSGPYPSYSDC